ncbi:MAG: anthrone oxygenase family protein [Pseudomonadota bacterium]
MPRTLTLAAIASILFTGAIFGFFFAWVCSTMWGLDAADPRVAIAAMQAMNASVRNVVFFPAFFLTPLVLGLTAFLAMRATSKAPAALFLAAALVYLFGGLVLTMAINVPMNEALALIDVPTEIDDARLIWAEYSGPWQIWNQTRTIASGLALALAALATARLAP